MLLANIAAGWNYGVACGFGNLCIVDADTTPVRDVILSKLPQTFSVTTGREGGGGEHFYFLCSTPLDKTHKLRDPQDPDPQHDIGHIKWAGGQAVGPNSIHPSGRIYTVKNDIDIATVKGEEILEAMRVWLQHEVDDQVHNEERQEAGKQKIPLEDLKVENVIDVSTMKQTALGYQGAHPIHGSTTGANFTVNTLKNVWHCFRCMTGGGPLALIAVKEGLLPCDQVRPGVIRGDLFKKTIEVAAQKYGLKVTRRRGRPRKEEDPFEEPNTMAEQIMKTNTFKTAMDTEELFIYKDGIYVEHAEVIVKQICGQLDPEKSSHYVDQVVFHIKQKTYVPREAFNADINLIPLKNGMLNLISMEIAPFNPEVVYTIVIPVEYKKDADCPAFKKFVSEVIKPGDIATMQEAFGCCLLRDYRFQKAFMFDGVGANGKSTMLNVLGKLLGADNVAATSLQDLSENRFAPSSLYGKLANIYADLPEKMVKYTGIFKILTGDDRVKCERKFVDGFKFWNHAKLFFSCNKVPPSGDDSDAYHRRWVYITFANSFVGDRADKNLIYKLTTPEELSGILNWAIEGLARLMKNGVYTDNQSTDELRETQKRKSDPLAAFVMDTVTMRPGAWITKDCWYREYLRYCNEKNLATVSKDHLGKKMTSTFPDIRGDYKRTTKNGKKWVWLGVAFNIAQVIHDGETGRDEGSATDLSSFEDKSSEPKPHDEEREFDTSEKVYFGDDAR